MKIKIIATGSKGNSYVVTDTKGKQLLLECGVKINDILRNVDLTQLEGCLISHYHNDHCLCLKNLKRYAVPTIEPSNIQVANKILLPSFSIFPIQSYHNIDCFGFIIQSKNDNKKILFVTDTTQIDPKIPDISFDLAMLECNYSESYVKQIPIHEIEQNGYENHMSFEYLQKWLKTRRQRPKTLCVIHLSSRGNLGLVSPFNELKQYADNFFVAEKNLTMEI